MSEHNDKAAKHSARAQARENRQKNGNIQYVRRVPEVNGTPYTEGMSEAYWRGVQDGESTAARMVRRADPKNVRVRTLAVISDEPEEQGIAVAEVRANDGQMVPAVQQSVSVALLTENEQKQMALPEEKPTEILPVQSENTGIAKQVRTDGVPIIGLKTREMREENIADIMNTNENKQIERSNTGFNGPTIRIETADGMPEVTYALRRDDISDGKMQSAGKSASNTAVKTAAQKNTEKGKGAAFIRQAKDRAASIMSERMQAGVGKGEKNNGSLSDTNSGGGELTVQKWKEMSILRRVIIILSSILFIYALSPLVLGIFNVGIVPLVLIAWFFFTVALLWNHIENCRSRLLNALFAAVAFIVVLGVIGMAFISGKMLGASFKTLPEDRNDVTVVVLGCLVIDDQPSLMLERRLKTAAEYLLSNQEAYCIVTGGQGENEDYPEAVVMKNYLVEAGVSADRIIVEQNSTSTIENIEFAAELIEKYNCHEDVAIVSDRFHQYRASLAAKDAGLNSYAMPCETAWYLVAHYWFREMAGIAQIWLQGQ